MPPLTTALLDSITQHLVAALQPEQIILFGSYAYGEPNEDSDIDLLVIVSQSDEPGYRRARVAYKALRGLGIPKNILLMTRTEVDRKKNVASSLVCEALHHGQVLYG
ncbi:nucleotidyltransferase domain-containing protein [Nodosilinea sp. LEGE 06152]|uniref:nucleotidyltransferase domain-containing protein n=1 Tax=Nodosilinea sp. LEGE 06152 TaxID=2777966 RepID=UPI0018818D7F|nr:nucleotidyltransferase domain-containing protein [Nodosilinea sp. LEGE 06152]MBE9159198.1 nucleotidyltransferase domain-containing protein [Nodosilinea sp. LEGE 06152]